MGEFEISVTMVINRCSGGFGLSEVAQRELAARLGVLLVDTETGPLVQGTFARIEDTVPRNNPYLIDVIRKLGKEANGPSADLRIVEVPLTVEVESSDGLEEVSVYAGGFST